jgi:hypothetical protein
MHRAYHGALIAVLSAATAVAGCGDDYGVGNLQVLLEPEATVTDGLDPGSELEHVRDGWTVRFTKYVIAVGDIQLGTSHRNIAHRDDTMHVVDMTSLPPAGFFLAQFDEIDARRWDYFGYTTGHVDGGLRDDSVSQEDMDEMAANGWTYLMEGTVTNPEGESCPPGGTCAPATEVAFRFGIPAYTEAVRCEAEGIFGVSVAENTTTSVNVSIHGDHLFFDSFPTGPEIVDRRAQWIANADLDQDGMATQEDLKAIALEDLFPSNLYSYEGAPFIELATAFDWLVAQSHTQPHFQGEGHCTWCELDGDCIEDDDDHGHSHD